MLILLYLLVAVLIYTIAWNMADFWRSLKYLHAKKAIESGAAENVLPGASALTRIIDSAKEVELDLRFLSRVDDASLQLYFLLTLGYPLDYNGIMVVKKAEPVYDFYNTKEPQIAEIIDRMTEGAKAINRMNKETLSGYTASELCESMVSRKDAEVLGSARKARQHLESCFRKIIRGRITPKKMNRKSMKILKAVGGKTTWE